MESDVAEVVPHSRPVQDEPGTGGIADVHSTSPIWGGHRNGGPGSNWVRPWLKTTNSSTCPYHCDEFEPRML